VDSYAGVCWPTVSRKGCGLGLKIPSSENRLNNIGAPFRIEKPKVWEVEDLQFSELEVEDSEYHDFDGNEEFDGSDMEDSDIENSHFGDSNVEDSDVED
jgi:hypothetical protein